MDDQTKQGEAPKVRDGRDGPGFTPPHPPSAHVLFPDDPE